MRPKKPLNIITNIIITDMQYCYIKKLEIRYIGICLLINSIMEKGFPHIPFGKRTYALLFRRFYIFMMYC